MNAWTGDELDKTAAAQELELGSVRRDRTLRNPVTIWVVRHGDDLYVRSAYGCTSKWFRGTQDRHEDHIRAGGVDKDVVFVEADDEVKEEIDAADRTKYHHYGARLVTPMVSPKAQSRGDQARAALNNLLVQESQRFVGSAIFRESRYRSLAPLYDNKVCKPQQRSL